MHGRHSMIYETILFDFDHTLFDSDTSEREAFATTLRAAGMTDLDGHFTRYRTINEELWAMVETGAMAAADVRTERFVRLVDVTGMALDPLRLADDYAAAMGLSGGLFPDVEPVLARLAARARLALVTNGLTEIQQPRIDRTGIARFFDVVVISSAVGHAKPDPAFFDVVFEWLGDPPRHSALIVGDSLTSDMAGGAAAGIDTCLYNPGGRSRPPGAPVTHEIRVLAELLDLVGC
jgi:2-haloacid dehalogenase